MINGRSNNVTSDITTVLPVETKKFIFKYFEILSKLISFIKLLNKNCNHKYYTRTNNKSLRLLKGFIIITS